MSKPTDRFNDPRPPGPDPHLTIAGLVKLDECLDRLHRLYDGSNEAKTAIYAVSEWFLLAGVNKMMEEAAETETHRA